MTKVQADFAKTKAKAGKGILESHVIVAVNVKGQTAEGHEVDDWQKLSFEARLLNKKPFSNAVTVGGKKLKVPNALIEILLTRRYMIHPDFKHASNARWCVLLSSPEMVSKENEDEAKKAAKAGKDLL